MADEPKPAGHDDLPPTKKLTYVFTVIMPTQELPDDPLAQRIYVDGLLAKINEHLKPARVGVVASMEG